MNELDPRLSDDDFCKELMTNHSLTTYEGTQYQYAIVTPISAFWEEE